VRRTIAQSLGFAVRRKREARDPQDQYGRVHVLASAVRTIAEESESKPGSETGGVLVGFFDSGLGAIVVTAASGPGPLAHHGPSTFNRDRAYCQAFLDTHAAATRGLVDFVGEWHKHPEPNPWPSPVDVKTYTRLAIDPQCHVSLPLVLIVGVSTCSLAPPVESYHRTNAFVFCRDGFTPRRVQLLPDEAYLDLLVTS